MKATQNRQLGLLVAIMFMLLDLTFPLFNTSYVVNGEPLPNKSAPRGSPNTEHTGTNAIPQSFPKFKSAVAGKMMPLVRSFIITPDKLRAARSAISATADVSDLLILVTLGWAMTPLVKYPLLSMKNKKENYNKENSTDIIARGKRQDYSESFIFQITDHIGQAARIALMVCLLDCIGAILPVLGFNLQLWNEATVNILAQVLYTVWAFSRVRIFKRYAISKSVSRHPQNLGKATIYDHLIDFVIAILTVTFIIDILPIDLGLGLKSLLTFGGVGTLIISMAVKDLAAEFLHGLWLFASEQVYEGESILLGDGTCGIVTDIDWMHTTVRGFDEVEIIIPNSQFFGGKLSNKSRITKCRVKQTLRFKHSDMNKIPQFIVDVKRKIKNCCPKLICDGSRPFQVHLRSIEETHLAVILDMHFDVKPDGDDDFDNRQNVLLAVGNILDKYQIELVQISNFGV